MSYHITGDKIICRKKGAQLTDELSIYGNPVKFNQELRMTTVDSTTLTYLANEMVSTGLVAANGAITVDPNVTVTLNGAQTLTNKTLGDNLDMDSNLIVNLGTPSADTDAANKSYVDALVNGLDVKGSCLVASTVDLDSNASISGSHTYTATGGTSSRGQITATLAVSDTFTVDGVTLSASDDGARVLLKDQTNAASNGIWVTTISGTSLTLDRATDFDEDDEVHSGAFTHIESGTVNDNNQYALTTADPIVIGGASGTNLTFTQFSGTGHITAGDGLSKTLNTLDVDLKTDGGLAIESSKLALSLGDTSITGNLSAIKVGDGNVSNAEFDRLNGVQSQLAGVDDVATLTNKTVTGLMINDTSSDHIYTIGVSELAADRTLTLPLLTGNDIIVTEAHTQSLTNKTIDCDQNTVTNIDNGNVKVGAGINVNKLGNLLISNAEFDRLNGISSQVVGESDSNTLTNKTIDCDLNTITNVADATIKSGAAIDAAKIHDGSVSNTEFGYLNGVTSAIQTQIDSKMTTSSYDKVENTKLANGPGAPTTSFDSSAGFHAGAIYFDSASDNLHVCTDASPGAATYIEMVDTASAQTLTNKTITNPSGLDANDVGLGNVANIKIGTKSGVPGSSDDTNSGYSVGSLIFDTSNDELYVCSDATASSATWYKASMSDLIGIDVKNISTSIAPGAFDDNTSGYAVHSIWCDTTADKAYICLDASSGAAVWKEITQSGGGGGGGSYTAGDGLDLSGTEFSLDIKASCGLKITSTELDVDTTILCDLSSAQTLTNKTITNPLGLDSADVGLSSVENVRLAQPAGNTNTCVGEAAGNSITSGGISNTCIGHDAGKSITTGDRNTCVGYESGIAITTGVNNVALGTETLNNVTTSNSNMAIGRASLFNVTSSNNVAIGVNAGFSLTTGANNTIIGKDGMDSENYTNCSTIGYQAAVTGNNQVQLGNSSTTTYAYGTVQNRSDRRDKEDIQDTDLGLKFIKKLRPVKFRWDYREDYCEVKVDAKGNRTKVQNEKDGSKKRKRFHQGVIAQELEDVCKEMKVDFGGLQHHARNGGNDVYSVGYEEFVAPLIKSVQQLSNQIEGLVKQNKYLYGRVKELEKKVSNPFDNESFSQLKDI